MTPTQFYDNLLDEIAVDLKTMDEARAKRDEVGGIVVREVQARLGTARWVPVGALAQGTYVAPLNDFDGVVEIDQLAAGWWERPRAALEDVRSWIEPSIEGTFEISSHAIKITFPEVGFTADLVIGWERQKGLLIPHCPKDERHRWIATDPKRHRQQVLERNKQFDSSIFTREIRILKWLDQYWKLQDPLERKPLSSFHITALALHLLKTKASHADWTPFFLDKAATLVLQPLPDPADVGKDIVARDPQYASSLLREAAAKTKQALTASPNEAERLLRNVFGHPKQLRTVVEQPTVSVGRLGALGVAPAVAVRHTRPVRSHGSTDR